MRFYYDDGSKHDGDPLLAATIGVIFIVEPRSGGRVIHNRNAYWILTTDGEIVPVDCLDGLIDQVLHRLDRIVRIYQGRSMTNDRYWEYYKRVKAENP
jgi:hypothetical protein